MLKKFPRFVIYTLQGRVIFVSIDSVVCFMSIFK